MLNFFTWIFRRNIMKKVIIKRCCCIYNGRKVTSVFLILLALLLLLTSSVPTSLERVLNSLLPEASIPVIRWKPGDNDSEYNAIMQECLKPHSDRPVHQQPVVRSEKDMTSKINMHNNVRRSDIDAIILTAKRISQRHRTVLVSVINDAYVPFLYSWLCNTADMAVHASLLVVTTDNVTVEVLRRDWPKVNAVLVHLDVPRGNQGYSRVGYVKLMVRRAEILLELLNADIKFMLTEFDYVWFENPLPYLEDEKGFDMLVNPVSRTRGKVYNGGLIYTFATEKSKKLWQKLVDMLKDVGKKLEGLDVEASFSQAENDQVFLSDLLNDRYADIKIGILPLKKFADGAWYVMPEDQRKRSIPIMISNNFIEGNVNKMKRAKRWGHWFLTDNCICDIQVVRRAVRTEMI